MMEVNETRGIRFDVYGCMRDARRGQEWTNGGISAEAEILTLIGWTRCNDRRVTAIVPFGEGMGFVDVNPTEYAPACVLVVREFLGEMAPYLAPAFRNEKGEWMADTSGMAGGHYGGGGAVTDLLRDYAKLPNWLNMLPIHDDFGGRPSPVEANRRACDECGAVAYEPCRPHCTAVAWQGERLATLA